MKRRPILPLAMGLMLAGCAENAVRLDLAGRVASESRQTARGVSLYFDAIEARRRATAAAMVASDPSCLPYLVLRVQVPKPETPSDADAALCVTGGRPRLGYDMIALDLGPTPETILRPRALLVTAVIQYGAALASMVDDPKADIRGELADFAEKVDRVGSFLGLVAGSDVPSAGGALDGAKGRAILDLIAFADMLAHEAGQVQRVRELVIAEGDKVDPALALIDEDIRVRVAGEGAGLDTLYADALRRGYRRDRARMTFADRRALAEMTFEADLEATRGPLRAKAVRAAIAETQGAQAELRGILAPAREWPRARRAEAARLNLDRLTRALGLLASLGRAVL